MCTIKDEKTKLKHYIKTLVRGHKVNRIGNFRTIESIYC